MQIIRYYTAHRRLYANGEHIRHEDLIQMVQEGHQIKIKTQRGADVTKRILGKIISNFYSKCSESSLTDIVKHIDISSYQKKSKCKTIYQPCIPAGAYNVERIKYNVLNSIKHCPVDSQYFRRRRVLIRQAIKHEIQRLNDQQLIHLIRVAAQHGRADLSIFKSIKLKLPLRKELNLKKTTKSSQLYSYEDKKQLNRHEVVAYIVRGVDIVNVQGGSTTLLRQLAVLCVNFEHVLQYETVLKTLIRTSKCTQR
jgi:hypothetical protein